MNFRSTVLSILVFFMICLVSVDIEAQCAMCRATMENNVSNGDAGGIAGSINTGILYLLAMPYLAALIIGIIWFKNKKKYAKRTTR